MSSTSVLFLFHKHGVTRVPAQPHLGGTKPGGGVVTVTVEGPHGHEANCTAVPVAATDGPALEAVGQHLP